VNFIASGFGVGDGVAVAIDPSYDQSGMSTQSTTAPTGSSAPDFSLPAAGGGTVTLSSYRGRPVVLAFLRGFA
jgi:hypothetical protein